MTDTDDSEARRLIDEVFGRSDGDSLQRAQQATAAFDTVAGEFDPAGDNLDAVAAAITRYIDMSPHPPRAAYELCAAGAVNIASLMPADSDDETFVGLEVELDDDADPMHHVAILATNAVAAGSPDLLCDTLMHVYYSPDGSDIYRLVVVLVALRSRVRRMNEDPQP